MGRHFLRLLAERISGAIERRDLDAANRWLSEAEGLVETKPTMPPGPLAHDPEARRSVGRMRAAVSATERPPEESFEGRKGAA